jgi:tetratricopeptide (TPR) repeat protein
VARPPTVRLLAAAATLLGVATLTLGWREGRRYERGDDERRRVITAAWGRDAHRLVEEALGLYAAGQYPRACEQFGRAAAADPASALRRQDVVRCFEGWGWHALREGRPDEAALLFGQGLAETPDDPALLKGLGLAAVHAGRPDDALVPLERAGRAEHDPEVRLLLAHLHDRRDDPTQAITNLRSVLAREPAHAAARRLLDKIEREQQTEAGFERDITGRFVVKYRGAHHPATRRAIAAHLETAAERVGRMLAYAPQQRTIVVLYAEGEFQAVTRAHSWATALFDGKIRIPLSPILPPTRDLERLVVHEYAHAVIHELSRGRAPRWLHEGLAQMLEGAVSDPMLRIAGGLTLAGVEALASEPDPLRARAGYDVALWIVGDLVDRGGLESVRELLARLGAGETVAQAMPRIYGLRLAELESQWRRVQGS